jgi:hypothetical protein
MGGWGGQESCRYQARALGFGSRQGASASLGSAVGREEDDGDGY